jgi:outer membrane protein assembly factor BamD
MFRKFRALMFSGCLVATAGCVSDKQVESPLHYTENAKRAYDEAMVAFFDHDWEYATQLFNDVKRKYGYSRYARLAELRLADIAYRQDKYAEAVGMYKSFVADYPNDPETPYARYKIAKAEFTDSGASILLPPLEERDLSNVREAHVALRALIGDYPDSEHGVELRYMLEVVTSSTWPGFTWGGTTSTQPWRGASTRSRTTRIPAWNPRRSSCSERRT